MDSHRKHRDRSPADMRGRRTNADRDSDTATLRSELLDQLNRLANLISTDDPGLCEEDLITLEHQLTRMEKFITRGLGKTQRTRNKRMIQEGRLNREYQKTAGRKRQVEEDEESSDFLPEKRQKVSKGVEWLDNDFVWDLTIPQTSKRIIDSYKQSTSATGPSAATTSGGNSNMPSSSTVAPRPVTTVCLGIDLSFTLIFRFAEVPNLSISAKGQTQYIRIPTAHLYTYAPFLAGLFSANRSPQWREANNHDDRYVYDPKHTDLRKPLIRSKVVYFNRVIMSKTLEPRGDGRYDAAKLKEEQRWAMLQRLVKWIASGDRGTPRTFEPPLSVREKRNILLLAETLECDTREFLASVDCSGN